MPKSKYKDAVYKWIVQLASRSNQGCEVYLVQSGSGDNFKGTLVFDLDFEDSLIGQTLNQHPDLLFNIFNHARQNVTDIDSEEELRHYLYVATVEVLSNMANPDVLRHEHYQVALNDLAIFSYNCLFDGLPSDDREGLKEAFDACSLFDERVTWQSSFVELTSCLMATSLDSKYDNQEAVSIESFLINELKLDYSRRHELKEDIETYQKSRLTPHPFSLVFLEGFFSEKQ